MKGRLARWLQSQWYDRTSPAAALKPLASLFGMAVDARRMAYRRGWKRGRRLPVPVIVVGNISVGGVGKTPLVIWLANFLSEAGYRPGVISRGYGGTSLKQPTLVIPDSDPRRVGDEPVLIAVRSGRPVCVHPDRVAAGLALLAAGDCDLLIADDGLQHYALARDIEIAVVDGARRFGNGHLLPAGPLREPVERLTGVDLLVCHGESAQPGEFAMQLSGTLAINLADATVTKPLADFAGSRVHALAGIGNPRRFFAQLRQAGVQIDERVFPDHHPYTADDIRFDDELPLLMTEKDAVKCRPFADRRHWYLPVTAQLPEAFGDRLLTLIKAISDGQETA